MKAIKQWILDFLNKQEERRNREPNAKRDQASISSELSNLSNIFKHK